MLKIYGVPISVHTRKVIVVALAKKLEHEVIPVVPVIPGNPPANWRELSPTGKIPALTDGDFTVADSAAICGYLERIHPARAGLSIGAARLRHGAVVRAVRGRAVSRCGASVVPGNLRLSEDPESGDEPEARRQGARGHRAGDVRLSGCCASRQLSRGRSRRAWRTSRWCPTSSPTSTSASICTVSASAGSPRSSIACMRHPAMTEAIAPRATRRRFHGLEARLACSGSVTSRASRESRRACCGFTMRSVCSCPRMRTNRPAIATTPSSNSRSSTGSWCSRNWDSSSSRCAKSCAPRSARRSCAIMLLLRRNDVEQTLARGVSAPAADRSPNRAARNRRRLERG